MCILPPESKPTTQRAAILEALRSGEWIPAYQLAKIVLRYGSRILELRRRGHAIESRVTIVDGQRHGAFRLVEQREPVPVPVRTPEPLPKQQSFFDLTPIQKHRDDN